MSSGAVAIIKILLIDHEVWLVVMESEKDNHVLVARLCLLLDQYRWLLDSYIIVSLLSCTIYKLYLILSDFYCLFRGILH